MGWRALRLALDRDTLMKAQARALLEAAAGRTLNVMFPMVSEPWEFDAAKAVFESQVKFLRTTRKTLPEAIRYGVMLEVPSLAETLDLLLPRIAFISIGTNDLTQFLFAADRAHPRLAERYDWLSPTVMRYLARVVRTVSGSKVALGVCGEMGGRPLEAMALLGVGIERLSITPAGVGPVKAMVRSIDAAAVRTKVESLLAKPPANMRKSLGDWAKKQGVALG